MHLVKSINMNVLRSIEIHTIVYMETLYTALCQHISTNDTYRSRILNKAIETGAICICICQQNNWYNKNYNQSII